MRSLMECKEHQGQLLVCYFNGMPQEHPQKAKTKPRSFRGTTQTYFKTNVMNKMQRFEERCCRESFVGVPESCREDPWGLLRPWDSRLTSFSYGAQAALQCPTAPKCTIVLIHAHPPHLHMEVPVCPGNALEARDAYASPHAQQQAAACSLGPSQS